MVKFGPMTWSFGARTGGLSAWMETTRDATTALLVAQVLMVSVKSVAPVTNRIPIFRSVSSAVRESTHHSGWFANYALVVRVPTPSSLSQHLAVLTVVARRLAWLVTREFVAHAQVGRNLGAPKAR
jgi:hypothetical protein